MQVSLNTQKVTTVLTLAVITNIGKKKSIFGCLIKYETEVIIHKFSQLG